MDFTYLTGTFILVSLVYIIQKIIELRKQPPGPWGLPFIGQLVTLNKDNALIKLQEWKKKYGKIFSFRVGNFNVIVINDYQLIQEALKKDEFQGRPDFEAWKIRNRGFKNRGVLFTDGDETWREQRRFALRNLRDLGFGKQSMEGMLLFEVQELVKKFKTQTGTPVDLKNNFNCSVFNSLWYILTGKRFELDDPTFLTQISKFSSHLDRVTLFSPASYFPWPAKYNLIRPGLWAAAMQMTNNAFSLMDEIIKEHLDSYQEGVTRDYVDIYLHSHYTASKGSSFFGPEGITNLRVEMLDLFVAGTETTSTTLSWAVLFMSKNPETQEKLHEEIDRVVGRLRFPTRDDRPNMPYFEAFLNEVHRKSSIIPMSVYHKVMQDCEFGGYFFKKNTVVYPNIYDAHHDEKYWQDPEVFRPERFLDETGTKVVQKDALMPFSTGKRVCLGMPLAQESLFLFLTGLVQNFSFELDKASDTTDNTLPKPNFVRSPYDFKVIINTR